MAKPELSTGEKIYQAAVGLHNAGRQISRQALVKVTGLLMGQIDDHVTRMVNEQGRLRRVANGVLELVEQFPANRPISKTVLPDGSVTIEVGDDVLQLTPGEAHVLGASLMPEATVYAQLRGDRDVQDQVSRLQRDLASATRRMNDMTRELVRLRQQPELALFDN